jgi:hypothetical protein
MPIILITIKQLSLSFNLIGVKMILMIVLASMSTALVFAISTGIANAQELPSIPVVIKNGTFENTMDGFRVQVPDGWVVQDIDNQHLPNYLTANEAGFLILAIICPQQEAVPINGEGLYSCEQSESSVEIAQDRLGHRPEFEHIEDPISITPNDFLSFILDEMQERNYTNIQIMNSTDITINITRPEDPNTTIRTASAKFVEMTYQPNLGLPDLRSYTILITIPENPVPGLRQVLSGNSVSYEGPAATTPSGSPPSAVQQIFQSLEFIRE